MTLQSHLESAVFRHFGAAPRAQPIEDLIAALRQTVQDWQSDSDRRMAAAVAAATANARRSEETYRSMFENATNGIFQTTPDGQYLNCNHALATIYGYESSAELKTTVRSITSQLYVDDETRPRFIQLMREHDRVTEFEARVFRKDGQIIWISETGRAVRDEQGNLLYYEGSVTDITARKLAEEALRLSEEQLARDALHDGLTGLPNRILFTDRLERSIARTARHPEHHYSVLFLDVDRFKVINVSLGHGVGDQLLLAFAQRLVRCLRPSDTVARLGGDEFTVLLEEPKDAVDAITVADRIIDSLKRPFSIGGQDVFVTTSIGIAGSSSGYIRPQDVMRDADTAMYRAKAMGKSRYEVFDVAMHARAVKLMQIENDLRGAIDRGQLELHYQPILDIASNTIRGFEALVRWRHPERGLIQPLDFISVAEETGLIIPLGQWVLREACRQATVWHQQFPARNLDISVNLSARQFSQADLVEQVLGVLGETGLAARQLVLEITESVVMENPESTISMLKRLKSLGVKLNIDDFGTGYSSLSYLQRFPVDTMKIDRSFISRMNEDPENAEIVRTIVTLAHNLKLKVTAEGIETAEQLSQLADLRCENAQGYFLSRPLTSVAATAMLSASALLRAA